MSNSDEKYMQDTNIHARWINLKEAARQIRMCYTQAVSEWPSWKDKYGITAHRRGKHLLFKASEIDRINEAHAIN